MAKKRGRRPKEHTEATPAWAVRLRGLREAAGLSCRELAALAGLDSDSVAHYDAGEVEPPVTKALALARALSAKAEEIWG